MIKTFKNAISMFLVVAFVLSLVPVVSFAADETHPGMFADDVSLKAVSTKSGWQRYDVVSDQYLGGKGDPYSLWGDSAGAPRREVSTANVKGAQDVLEFSLYVPSDSQGMSFEIAVYGYPNPSESNYSAVPLILLKDGLYTNFSGGPNKMISFDAADKWVNLAFVSPEPYDDSAASNTKTIDIYVNGVLKKSYAMTYSKSGFRHLRFNARGGTSALNPVMYVDNVRIHNDAYQPEYDVVDEISYVNGIENGALLLKGSTTVAQLKEGITKKTDTTIRVYKTKDSTQPLSDDEIVEAGYMVVAAAKNGADMERSYSYYTTDNYIKKYPDINDGSNTGTHALKRKSGTSGTQEFTVLTGNFAGKENEQYILWSDSDGTYQRQIPITNASGKQDTLEMSFLIPSGSNGFTIGQHLSNTAGTSATGLTLWFKPTGIYGGWKESTASRICTIETDKWYSFALVTPTPYSDGSEPGVGTTTIYLNGEKYTANTNNTKTGFRYLNVKCMANGDLIPAVYLDNIRVHSETYEPEYDVVDEISYEGGIEESTILTSGTLTVGQLKAGITKKADTTIRVYESISSTEILSDDEEVKDGYIVVAAAKNGSVMERSYNYYTTGKYIRKYPGINDGTTILTKSDTSSSKAAWYQMESVNDNIGGKGDAYLLMADSSGVSRTIALTDATGAQDVFEMSFYVPSDSDGVSLSLYFTDLNSSSVALPLLIKPDGLYTNWSGGANRFHTLKPDRWYNFGFVTPKPYVDSAANNSDEVQMYINGELIDVRASTYTKSGFRNKIFTASLNGNSSHETKAYYDNIRVHSGTYDAEYDVLDNISYKDGIGADNNIIVKGATTVAELKAGITKKEDTTIKVYSSFGSTEILSDDAYVEDGYVVVAAAKNGSVMERSYNYYTVDKVKRYLDVNTLVNGAAGKIYDDDDTISVSATYENYDASDAEVAMYTAVYKYGKLVKIYEDSKTVEVNKTGTFNCDFAELGSRVGTNVKVMLWNATTQTPYLAASAMRYNSENTKATLYLLGDSIVQTYVNPGYPIQGWGYYIGDYLNDNITVENRATSGWTTDHYLYPDGIYTREDGVSSAGMELLTTKGAKKTVGESNRHKIWSNILSELKEGDYVMVSLGINDMGSGNVPSDRYLENITTIYNQATAKGATVIFSTPTISGNDWNKSSNFGEGWAGYGKICNEFATARGAVCIPLGATLVKTYNNMVTEYMEVNNVDKVTALNYVRNYFHIYAVNGTPPEGWDDFGTKTTDDSTHHNVVSSNVVAGIIVDLLKEAGSPVADYAIN